jgi:hypothetical protein
MHRTHLLFCLVALLICTGTVGAQTTRPAIVSAKEWGSEPLPIPDARKHTPAYITVHHSGVLWINTRNPQAFVRSLQKWGQRDKKWPDLPYHFLIGPDGRIFEGRPVEYEPESNTNYALAGNIGVELMGDFNRQRPSEAQLEAMARLVAWLCQDLKISPEQIRGHRDAAPGQTNCPGTDLYRYVNDGTLKGWVELLLNNQPVTFTAKPPLPNGPTTRNIDTTPAATQPS